MPFPERPRGGRAGAGLRPWLLGGLALLALGGASDGPQPVPEPLPAHHTPSGFRNNYPHEEHGMTGALEWGWQRRGLRVDRIRFPVAENDPGFLRDNRTRPTLTWVGHSTFLLQYGGVNVLTDPHFTERASPVGFAGPDRTTPPGLELRELPPIDLVVISHNHYDHLDHDSIVGLWRRYPKSRPAFLVPLGLAERLSGWGVGNVTELDWWQSDERLGLVVRAVPVQHFSARTWFDRNRTLWAGWVLEWPGFRFFFAGDSGYSRDFADIRERLGPVDLAALPIGAYEPRWFMRSMHVNPEEAVRVHRDLDARYSVGMHWGTFILTDEPMDEPLERLASARTEQGVPAERFFVLQHGETRRLDFLAR